MTESSPSIATADFQPVVLVGGRSRRFGSDKLVAPMGSSGRLLAQQPIEALRSVFGPRVKLVGDCDPRVRACADGQIPDLHPGLGPLGGLISALTACASAAGGPGELPKPRAVFVLAGDMPLVTPDDIRTVLRGAIANADAWAVLAMTDEIQPCAGVYRIAALAALESARKSNQWSLRKAIPPDRIAGVVWPSQSAHNVNRIEDLPGTTPERPKPLTGPAPTDPPTSPATLS